MIGTIYIALTGLRGYERGLQVISNNTANLNSPGFKGSTLQFADIAPVSGEATAPGFSPGGLGLSTLGTMLMFQQGELRTTNNDLDCAIDGLGLFTIRDKLGNIRYTRDGQFKFNTEGGLVTTSDESEVMTLDAGGGLVPITIANLRTQYARATETVTFSGYLSTGMTETAQGTIETTIPNVTVLDRAGSSHTYSLHFVLDEGTGSWRFTVREGNGDADLLDADGLPLGGTVTFVNGEPLHDESNLIHVQLPIAGQERLDVALDFRNNVRSRDEGSISNLTTTHDGYAPGSLTATTFDAQGSLVLTYSNGQTVRNQRLALARFDSLDAVRAIGAGQFEAITPAAWVHGVAGEGGFGSVKSAMVEMSNVDLSSQFSDLVIMQRGYQASSQVVSTANEMLADLFGIKNK